MPPKRKRGEALVPNNTQPRPPILPDPQEWIARIKRLTKIAKRKFGGWATNRPGKTGLWFGAKWQHAGFYHVQRYPLSSSLEYLQSQKNDFWAGPFSRRQARSQWTWHVPPPSPSTPRNNSDQALTNP